VFFNFQNMQLKPLGEISKITIEKMTEVYEDNTQIKFLVTKSNQKVKHYFTVHESDQ